MIKVLIILVIVAVIGVAIFCSGYTYGKLTGICDGLQEAIDVLEEQKAASKEQEE